MIFLSYSWRDEAAARSLDRLLRNAGFSVWMDFRELNLSCDLVVQLEAAIRQCALFVMWKPRDESSLWMRAERNMAIGFGKPIIELASLAPIRQPKTLLAVPNLRRSSDIGYSPFFERCWKGR